jgi:hypothetical protein
MSTVVACSKCERPIDPHYLNIDHAVNCAGCGSELRARVFPALFHRPAKAPAATIAAESEASCFYHADNLAVTACDSCGRFLCGLCRVEFSGQNICPSCINSGIRTRKLIGLESHRTMYDTIALLLATIPFFLVWPSLLAAPAALYVSIRYWRAPSSVVRRSKIRFVIAIVLALSQIGLWIAIAILLFSRRPVS